MQCQYNVHIFFRCLILSKDSFINQYTQNLHNLRQFSDNAGLCVFVYKSSAIWTTKEIFYQYNYLVHSSYWFVIVNFLLWTICTFTLCWVLLLFFYMISQHCLCMSERSYTFSLHKHRWPHLFRFAYYFSQIKNISRSLLKDDVIYNQDKFIQ